MAYQRFQKINQLLMDYQIHFTDPELNDDVKCGYCKSVLKFACQLHCGCKLCRSCIDYLITNGIQCCPAPSDDCRDSYLTNSVNDFQAIRKLSSMFTKCPYRSCAHECRLNDLEGHMNACPRRTVNCSFFAFGCTERDIAFEEMDAHFQTANRRHGEILIDMISIFNNEMTENRAAVEELRRTMQPGRSGARVPLVQQQNQPARPSARSSGDDDASRPTSSSSSSIEARCDQSIRQLKDLLLAEIARVRDENRAVVQNLEARLARAEATRTDRFNGQISWTIRELKIEDRLGCDEFFESDFFHGTPQQYRYRLSIWKKSVDLLLYFRLLIYVGDKDEELQWPFLGNVTIAISDRADQQALKSITQRCEIDRPREISNNCSDAFIFNYVDWLANGLTFDQGLSVKCSTYLD